MKKTTNYRQDIHHGTIRRKVSLIFYDAILLAFADLIIMGIAPSSVVKHSLTTVIQHYILAAGCIYLCRRFAHVYRQVWRYGNASAYIRILIPVACAGCIILHRNFCPRHSCPEYRRHLSVCSPLWRSIF